MGVESKLKFIKLHTYHLFQIWECSYLRLHPSYSAPSKSVTTRTSLKLFQPFASPIFCEFSLHEQRLNSSYIVSGNLPLSTSEHGKSLSFRWCFSSQLYGLVSLRGVMGSHFRKVMVLHLQQVPGDSSRDLFIPNLEVAVAFEGVT